MKLIDKTPFRSETGEISFLNRIQGMVKYGPSWFDRIQAQDAVAAIFAKVLGGQYVLLQNITLPETDIDLPMILLGPAGIFLINAIHEKGVYRARDEEWGTISGDQIAPARINQVKRTLIMGRVLQTYFDRQGYQNVHIEPILMSADPALHIDSSRPAVRVVMSDALERFAISLGQSTLTLALNVVSVLESVLLHGKPNPVTAPAAAPAAAPAPAAGAAPSPAFTADSFDFSFAPEETFPEAAAQPEAGPETAAAPQPRSNSKPKKTRKKNALTRTQLIILALLGLCWLCSMTLVGLLFLYSQGILNF